MNILKLLTYKEKIGGIGIFDSKIEMLLLDFKQKEGLLSIEASFSVDLPIGTIEGGIIKNNDVFVSALLELLLKIKQSKARVSSFIISLPSNFVYGHNFSFPSTLSDVQIDEAMKLNLKFSLPMSQELEYIDWEPIESREVSKKEIILCAVDREAVDEYLSAFQVAEITPVAIEFHGLSVSRVANFGSKEPTLIAIFSRGDLEFVVVESGAIRFLQAFNINRILDSGEDKLKSEKDIIINAIWRIVNYYDSEKNQKGFLNKIYLVGDYDRITIFKDFITKEFVNVSVELSPILPVFPQISLAKNSNLAHITFGAALRGLMPRSEDMIISLMPIGTEEAYERKRVFSFVKIASDLVSVLSIFFIVLFLGAWILMSVLSGNIDKSLGRQVGLPEGLLKLKEEAVKFNDVVKKVNTLDQQTPKWSRLVERIGALGTFGVALTRVDATSLESVTISGAAITRDNLLYFKTVLENSNLFTEVKMPLNYLEQKDNINFSLTLKLKSPDFILE